MGPEKYNLAKTAAMVRASLAVYRSHQVLAMPAFLQQPHPPVPKPMSGDAAVLADKNHHLKGLDKLEEILLADTTTDE